MGQQHTSDMMRDNSEEQARVRGSKSTPAAPRADSCGYSHQGWRTRPHPSLPGQHPGLALEGQQPAEDTNRDTIPSSGAQAQGQYHFPLLKTCPKSKTGRASEVTQLLMKHNGITSSPPLQRHNTERWPPKTRLFHSHTWTEAAGSPGTPGTPDKAFSGRPNCYLTWDTFPLALAICH